MANKASQFRAENPDKPVVKRDRTSIHFDLGGGKRRAYFSIDPLHYGTDANQEIDTAWVNAVAPWNKQMVLAAYNAYALNNFNSGQIVKYVNPGSGHYITFQPQQLQWTNNLDQIQSVGNVQSVQAAVTDNVLKWTGAFGSGKDFSWVANSSKLIKYLDIANFASLGEPAQYIIDGGNPVLRLQFIFTSLADLYVNGVLWDKKNTTETTDNIVFKDPANGQMLWQMYPPFAQDQTDISASPIFKLRKQGNNLFVEVRVPYQWLHDAVYPVKIDPTLTDGYGGDVSSSKDTKFNPYSPANNYGAVNNYFTGSEGGGSGLIQFDASSIPAGSTCDDARFYNYHMAVGTNMAWTTTVYSIAVGNAGWPEGTHENATGGAGDSCYDHLDQAPGTETNWHGSAGCNTSGEDYEASALGTFSGNRTDAIGTEYHVHLTVTRVDDWFGSPNTNYGLKLISATNDIGALCSSDYATTAYRPKLVIDYTEAASGVEVAPDPASAVGSRLGPTVVLGNLSLSPTAKTAVASRLGPTVELGDLSITPAARTAVASRLGPTVVLGSLSLSPTARTAVAVSIDPTVITISILFTPDPASSLSVSANPMVIFGSLALTPTARSSVSVSIPPAVLYGSTIATPTPTTSVVVTQTPVVVLGSITTSPTAGTAVGVTIAPTLIHGSLSLSPVPGSSVSFSIDPTILVLNLIAVTLSLLPRTLGLTLLDRDTVDNTMHFLLPNGVNKWLFGDGSEIVQIDQCIHLSLNTRSLALTLQVRDAVYSLSHILLPNGVNKWLFGDGSEIIFVDEGIHLTLLPRNLTLTLGAHE